MHKANTSPSARSRDASDFHRHPSPVGGQEPDIGRQHGLGVDEFLAQSLRGAIHVVGMKEVETVSSHEVVAVAPEESAHRGVGVDDHSERIDDDHPVGE